MLCLDLCSGSGSVSRALQELCPGCTVISLDVDPRNAPDVGRVAGEEVAGRTHVTSDIRMWVPDLQPGEVDFMWCSPPCEQYSIARQSPRNLELADSIAARCFELVDILKPKRWVIENPGTGLMHKRPFALQHERWRSRTTYCSWGTPYKKLTSLWTNIDCELPVCNFAHRCAAFTGTGHPATAQKGPSRLVNAPASVGMVTTKALWAVPQELLRALVDCDRIKQVTRMDGRGESRGSI